ncbi:MAG: YfiR family protein [Armatimonadota bacterium]|nr:YfiR family protein [bacterium]MDW8320430.1 YfiR family protein [Armatimonadota bacterium]
MAEYRGGSDGLLSITGVFRCLLVLLGASETSRGGWQTGTSALLRITACLATLLTTFSVLATAVAQGVSETEVKAAFVYHFTGYVEWPASAFADSSVPFVIGVVGKSEILQALQNAVRGKNWNGRGFTVKRVETGKEMRACHVLFVAGSEAGRFTQIVEMLGDAPVLTIGESEGFVRKGGVINFYTEQNRVRFEINPDAARRARLTISSKLLNLAKIVRL